jgi:Terminase RNaseH-like domain
MKLRVGVDIGGGRHDRTAICVAEILQGPRGAPSGPPSESVFAVRHLERMASLTPIDVVVARLVELAATPELDGAYFYIDATGIGSAVVDLLNQEHRQGRFPSRPVGLALTGGREAGERSVPKEQLINKLVAAYNGGRLSFAAGLPILADLIKELAAYTPQVRADGRIAWGNDAKLSEFDDCVIALGLAILRPYGGGVARYIARTDGCIYASRLVSPDPY